MPRLYILAGCNGAGKTTASYTRLPSLLDCSEFVNSDEFAKSFSPFRPEDAAFRAGRFMVRKMAYLFQRREDFCIETTLATRSLLQTIRQARDDGYHVTLLFLWLASADLAVERVAARVAAGGHDIPEEIIRRRYDAGLKYFFKDYIPACDQWILADNTHPPLRRIASGGARGVLVDDPETYHHIRALYDC